MSSSPPDVLTVIVSLARYWLRLRPLVGTELRRWERHAAEIPNPTLRTLALTNLREESVNAEGAAVFATLAPLAQAGRVARLLAHMQITYDYLDSVSEQPAADPVANGMQLHRATETALQPGAATIDYYRYGREREDGGYLRALIESCQEGVASLPSMAAVLPSALGIARRCREAQTYTHGAIHGSPDALIAWAARQQGVDGYRWWEIGAAGITTFPLHALLAIAAWPNTTTAEAVEVDRAYFPSFCALSSLLDSLGDQAEDASVPSHSSISHYASAAEAANRLGEIVSEADAAVRALPRGRRHAAIVAGDAGYNLSSPGADPSFSRPVEAAIAARLGLSLQPTLAAMRLRHRLV